MFFKQSFYWNYTHTKMKKIIISSLLSLFSLTMFAQQLSVLTILGQATVRVIPDVTTINIALTSVHPEYSQAIQNLEQKASDLKSFLEDQGISEDYIDSENFQIDKQFDFVNGERKYMGYNAKLWIELKFQNDNENVNTIINSISNSKADAEISINYELSLAKQDSINTHLIQSAIEDARKKAKLIANSTGQELAKIHKINYGVRDNVVIDNSMNNLMVQQSMGAGVKQKSFRITPKEIVESTHIIIYWFLKEKS